MTRLFQALSISLFLLAIPACDDGFACEGSDWLGTETETCYDEGMSGQPKVYINFALANSAAVSDTDHPFSVVANSTIPTNEVGGVGTAINLAPGHMYECVAVFGATFSASTAEAPYAWYTTGGSILTTSTRAKIRPGSFAGNVENSFAAMAYVDTTSASGITQISLHSETVVGTVTMSRTFGSVKQVD